MTAFPDFAAHGFQVIKDLGHNLEGGRFTYLAIQLADNTQVVIKQFQFSKGAGWDGFRAIALLFKMEESIAMVKL